MYYCSAGLIMGEVVGVWGGDGVYRNSVLSGLFCCESKTALIILDIKIY